MVVNELKRKAHQLDTPKEATKLKESNEEDATCNKKQDTTWDKTNNKNQTNNKTIKTTIKTKKQHTTRKNNALQTTTTSTRVIKATPTCDVKVVSRKLGTKTTITRLHDPYKNHE